MAIKIKTLNLPRGTKLSEMLGTELRYLSNDIVKKNNIDVPQLKLFVDAYDMPIELEFTGQLPKDLNKYDKVELVNSELVIKPKSGKAGDFISSEITITGACETLVKINDNVATKTQK